MKNKEFSIHLEKRTLKFGINIIGLSTSLPNTTEGRVIKNQLTKSGTSIGANYREAKLISETKFKYVKVKPVKHYTDLIWLLVQIF